VAFAKIEIRVLQDMVRRVKVCQLAPGHHILRWEIDQPT
jgi:hypothetical protein